MLGARSHIQHLGTVACAQGAHNPVGRKKLLKSQNHKVKKHWETIPLPLLPKHHSQGKQHFAPL